MIDHVSIAVRDLERARRFYEAVLGAIGYAKLEARPATVGFGKTYPEFWINLRATMAPVASDCGSHVGLRVRTVELVDAFHAAALAAGGSCDGAPGLRPQHGEGYYAGFIRDPEGNRLEAVTFLKADSCPPGKQGTTSMRARILIPALMVAAGLATAASGQGAPRVVVGDNPSLSGAPLYVALEKGYYREAGIDVRLEMSGTSSDMAVLLATNRLQVIGGALSAGFFNSLSKGLPIGLLMARATSPYFHYLMIRPELKTKLREPADLKGRTVAIAARGAILVYELANILEAGGLSLADVELKYIPFGQMATALTTGAVDAALMISPLQDQVEAKGIGVKWINADSRIKAQPVLVSVWQMNTDWMRQNEDAARKFVRATLRGVRDYCNAYHRGPNRNEITRILAKYSDVKDPALINRIEWGATDVHGRIFEASVSDIQDTFLKEKLVADRVPIGRIAPVRWVGEVAAGLGPFRLVHDDGTAGCR